MKTFTPLFILFLSLSTSAQEWAPIGTQWKASWRNLAYSQEYFMNYSRDTVIDNRNCAFIEKSKYGHCNKYGEEHFIAHFDSNRLYLYDELAKEFFLLIDYNAEVGDSWQIASNLVAQTISPLGTTEVTVDSIGYEFSDFSMDSLKAWYVNLCYTTIDSLTFCEPKVILEKVGFMDMIYPDMSNLTGSLCDASWEGPLLCYSEPGGFEFSLTDGGCLIGAVNDLDVAQVATVYPNPFKSNLNIELKEPGKMTIMLFSANGQQILRQQSSIPLIELELAHLESGIYFLQLSKIQNGIEKKYFKKIIKP